MEPSESVEARIEERAQRLERFADDITSCHVVVEKPPSHQRKGSPYEVRIHLELPGAHVDVTREPARDPRHEDVFIAIADAFDRAVRMVEEHARKRRANAKRNPTG